MTMILLFKLATTPFLIAVLTLLVRRFGPAVGGLARGVPLVPGPIAIFTAIEQGRAFAAQAAIASLVGQVSTCIFCFAYARAARRAGAWPSAGGGIIAFLVATLLWSEVRWTLLSAIALLLATLMFLARAMPSLAQTRLERNAPWWWDVPLRMLVSAGFVLALSSATGHLGPQLSGLLAPFPVFVLILGVMCHRHEGGEAAGSMMRGVAMGSLSFTAFFAIAAATLPSWPMLASYGAATLASMAASGIVYFTLNRPARLWPWAPATRCAA